MAEAYVGYKYNDNDEFCFCGKSTKLQTCPQERIKNSFLVGLLDIFGIKVWNAVTGAV